MESVERNKIGLKGPMRTAIGIVIFDVMLNFTSDFCELSERESLMVCKVRSFRSSTPSSAKNKMLKPEYGSSLSSSSICDSKIKLLLLSIVVLNDKCIVYTV